MYIIVFHLFISILNMVSENSETLVYQRFTDAAFSNFTSTLKTLEQCGFQRLDFLHFLVFRAFFFSWR